MTGNADAEMLTDEGAMRWFNRLVYGYLVVLVVVFFALTFFLGTLLAGAVVLVGHLLLHAPMFEITGRLNARNEEPADVVREELSSIRNPLTATWLADAEVLDSDSEPDSVRFTRSGPLDLFSKQYWLTVTTTADETTELTIERDGASILMTRATTEPTGTGTKVELTFERDAVHAFSLLLMWLLRSPFSHHLTAAGYDIVRETSSVGVRVP